MNGWVIVTARVMVMVRARVYGGGGMVTARVMVMVRARVTSTPFPLVTLPRHWDTLYYYWVVRDKVSDRIKYPTG